MNLFHVAMDGVVRRYTPVAKWLAGQTANLVLWGLKPTWAPCASELAD